MLQIEAGILKLAFQRVVRIFVFPRADQACQAIHHFRIERTWPCRFHAPPNFPRYVITLAVIAAPKFSVAFVHILDRAFPLVAAGKIEVDIRPLTAFFREKALEQKSHADGIHSGDSQCITDRAVRRRSSPLHQNIFLRTKSHDVPHNQEITGKIKLFDQRQARGRFVGGPSRCPCRSVKAFRRACGHAKIASACRHPEPDTSGTGNPDLST